MCSILPISIDVEYDDDQTAYMSNLMAGGEYVYEDGVIYSHGFDSEGTPILMSFAFDPDKDKDSRITDVKYLDTENWPSYITVEDGYIYYIAHTCDEASQVCRIKTDGSDKTVIYKNNADCLQVDGDRLYFTDENHNLVSTDLEGEDLETLIDREVYYTYHICDDWFVFQDDADEESLHIANSSTGEDRRLSSGIGYGSVIDGSYLYYVDVTDTENYTGNLVKLNLKTMEEERSDVSMHDGLNISRTQMQGYFRGVKVSKDEWNKLEDADQEMSDYYLTKYFTDEMEVYWYYDADGLITQIAIDTDNGAFTAFGPKMEEK